jgi:hypothetical protein
MSASSYCDRHPLLWNQQLLYEGCEGGYVQGSLLDRCWLFFFLVPCSPTSVQHGTGNKWLLGGVVLGAGSEIG